MAPPRARAGGRPSPGLPRDESAFFGREAEISDVSRRLEAGARLVSVTGLGGVGKSRLALAVASGREEVLYVSLGDATSLEASVRAVARAAGVRLSSESRAEGAVDAVGKALAARAQLLVVLDEAEPRTTGAKELVTGLLARAPAVVVLATAREPLGVKGEERLLLGPLPVAHAVALLRDRARVAAGREIEIDDATAAAIVARVDALPLAVELAAARLDVLAPPELLARLGALPALRASLEASWQLLSAAEQRTLAQVSTFAGAFDVDAAERVVDLGAGEGADVVEVLSALVQRSLVVRADVEDASVSRARLRVLETVRTWAREKLRELGEEDSTSRRHLAWVLGASEREGRRTYGAGGARALDELSELLPEAALAFERWRAAEPALAARLVLAIGDLLLFRGLLDLRAALVEGALEAAERAGDRPVLARALALASRVDLELGKLPKAEAGLRRAIAIAGEVSDTATRLDATRTRGWLQIAAGSVELAERDLEEARAAHRSRGEARGEADACAALGVLFALTGRRAEALARMQAALGIHVATGDVLRQEKVLGFGALVGFEARELARGLPRDVLSRAPLRSLDVLPASVADMVATEAEAGRRWREALDEYLAGAAAEGRGETAEAIAAFERAGAGFRAASMPRGLASVHAHAAVAFETSGDSAEADARLALARASSAEDEALGRVVDAFSAVVLLVRARAADRDLPGATAAAERELGRARLVEGAPPELVAVRAVLERLLGVRPASSPPVTPTARSGEGSVELAVGPESRWVEVPGAARLDLVRYGPVRRLLDALVEKRLAQPGEALSAEDLIAAGWPGERMRHTAGLLRVYSGVRRLRRMGLEALLVTRDDGYLLDPNVRVRRVAD